MKGRIGEIVKKNLISIICGVIALAAVGVAFTMLAGEKEALQKDLDARKATYQSLNTLLTNTRTLPTISIDPGAAAEKLPKFPSEKIIQQGDAMVAELTKASKEIMEAAIKMNTHAELEPGALPAAAPVAAFRFRDGYQRYFPLPPASPLLSKLAQDLKAGMPPTPDEIKLKIDQKAQEIRNQRLIVQGAFNNQQQVDAEVAEMARTLPGQLRKDVAENSKVYINPQTFQPWPNILAAAGAPTDGDIFRAQLMLWMQQDVVSAVNHANRDAKSVKDSVVKHLKYVIAQPVPVLVPGETPGTDPDAEVTKKPLVSPTGRASNGMYDVFHLVVEADVEAAKLPEFLRSFGHRQFMTPLWADMRSVDLATERAAGHDYGDQPVVNVRVTTEVLYLRAWSKRMMPKEWRVALGLPETDAPADGAAPAAAPAADPAAAPAGASGGAP